MSKKYFYYKNAFVSPVTVRFRHTKITIIQPGQWYNFKNEKPWELWIGLEDANENVTKTFYDQHTPEQPGFYVIDAGGKINYYGNVRPKSKVARPVLQYVANYYYKNEFNAPMTLDYDYPYNTKTVTIQPGQWHNFKDKRPWESWVGVRDAENNAAQTFSYHHY